MFETCFEMDYLPCNLIFFLFLYKINKNVKFFFFILS